MLTDPYEFFSDENLAKMVKTYNKMLERQRVDADALDVYEVLAFLREAMSMVAELRRVKFYCKKLEEAVEITAPQSFTLPGSRQIKGE